MSKTAQLGIFFLLGIVILLIIFEVVSGVSFFKSEKTYTSYFSSVGELRVGSEVKLSGVEVGRVKGITLAGQNVEIEMAIDENVMIRKDSKASINMTSLLGTAYVGLTFGSPNSPILREGDVIPSLVPVDFNTLITKLDVTVDMFNNQLFDYDDKIKSILGNLNKIVASVASSEGTFGKLVNDPEIYNELNSTLEFFSSISNKIDSGEGTLGMLVNDQTIYLEAKKALVKLNYITEQMTTGQGSLGKLLNDDELYNSINELSANLNALVGKINRGQGTLGKLINDDRLYYDALNSVRKLKNAAEVQEDLAPLTTITAAFGVMTLF
ncbi:MAG TPA: MCE family protein [Candidatus Dadabacteria bacterium]|jgi:phospholipid/cholesterol/gamma-HCH transport system substrate-binding protein|nr:MCE family protein [Candidatus Dadabacteria bacterium]